MTDETPTPTVPPVETPVVTPTTEEVTPGTETPEETK